VNGNEGATTGLVYGVEGFTASGTSGASGVDGADYSSTGAVYGVIGSVVSTTNYAAGVNGIASATTGMVNGVVGNTSSSTDGASGVNGYDTAITGAVYGVTGSTSSSTSGAAGVLGFDNASTGAVFGVNGQSQSTTGIGVFGTASATSGFAIGVAGQTASPDGVGGEFANTSGSGLVLVGQSGSGFTQIFSVDASGNGVFAGNLSVTGSVSKGSGSFKIDDPLDPARKYLYHSFVESPDMMNVYNGNITTDKHGLATVTLPEYFDALNRDFRYQLTVIGQFAQAIVQKEIDKNRFVIRTSKPGVKVSWQVTGIRQDAYANAHRIPVEEEKPAGEQGTYLHPELFGQPASKSIAAASKPPTAANGATLNSR
jgi:trimeric autotransporter adhesin